MFLVSSGFSWEKSGDLVWGSDSPVSEELSTYTKKSTSSYTRRQLPTRYFPILLLHSSPHSQHRRLIHPPSELSFPIVTTVPCNHVQIWSEGQLEFCLLLLPPPDLQLQHLQHLCSFSHHFWLQVLAKRQWRNNLCQKQLLRQSSKDLRILK